VLILVDTSCWIEFFRPTGSRKIRDEIRYWLAADQVALCGPVLAEILRGARKAEAEKIKRTFSALHYLETLDSDWKTVSEKAEALSEKGHRVPLSDILITVIAARTGVTVAHNDKHFRAIQKLLPVSTQSFV
jgi:predicted nucleic acid-binding protein